MSQTNNDRNLLFGILAVQLDFVSRDALMKAMNAWVLAKEKALGEILVEQKALAVERRTLLEALVDEHLKQHGNDPEKSLAAISSLGPIREDLRQITDADVQATLAHVPAAPPSFLRPDDVYATMGQSVGSSTSQGTRFRILRAHAKGGLGRVSVARDEELQREVALKEIQEKYADNPESRARFMLEAEVTGALEHPGIVPVYGLGQYADGRPYYAMRFIRGDSLQDAVARFHRGGQKNLDSGERALELRLLLGRFIDVCNAIAYAHSRCILHRDLKPDNIMLGQYGETLVVDWGLAKPQDSMESKSQSVEGPVRPSARSGSAVDLMGSAVGTPKYMSPEQASGRLDLLGPTTDVYSLGATLYCVLTGRAPIEGPNLESVLQNVQRGEFSPPRAVNSQIPRPLEAVCLKAMALKPEDRYQSPKDIADDVEHWLADEPVSAYREHLPARVARWARKHKTLVVSSVGAIFVAMIALAVTTVLVKQQQRQTEEARQQAVVARDQARRRFGQALGALNDMVQGIQAKLKIRPDTEDLRKDLLENARVRVKELLQEAERQGNPDQTLVWSYFGMGDVDQVIGDTLAAQKEYASGSDLASKLAAASPNDSSAQSDLGISYVNCGNIALQLGQTPDALDFYQKALTIRQHRVDADPQDAKAKRGLSITYELLGDATKRMGRTQEAFDNYKKAATIRQQLADAEPANDAAQYDLSVNCERLGDITMQLGRTLDARDYYEKALAIRARLAGADPKNALAKRNLSVIYERLGDVTQQLNKMSEARDYYTKAADICTNLAEADPKNAQALRDLGVSLRCLGELLQRMGQTADALADYRKELAIYERLAKDDAKNVQLQNDLSAGYDSVGDVLKQTGQSKEALEYYQKSLAIRERLAAVDKNNAEMQRNRTISYNKLGTVALLLGQKLEALDFFQKALATRQQLADADPGNTQTQRDRAFSCEKLGDVTLQLGRAKEAVDFYQKAQMTYERLAEMDPKNANAQLDVSTGYYHLACAYALLSSSDDKDSRDKDARQALDYLRKGVDKGVPDLAHLKSDKRLDPLREREDFKKLVAELEREKKSQ